MEKLWRDYCTEEKMNYFKHNVEDCNITVWLEGKEKHAKQFKSYKFILSSVSSIFKSMFNEESKTTESTGTLITINDVHSRDFEIFLKIACDEDPYVENWKRLYDVATKFNANEIIISCINMLFNIDKTPLELVYLFEIVHLEGIIFNSDNQANIRGLTHAFQVKCPHIYNLNSDIFLKLLRIMKNEVRETEIFQAIERYCSNDANFNSNSQKFYFMNLFLYEVNFLKMNLQDFLIYIEGSHLLSISFKHKILVDICRKSVRVELVEKF